MLTVHPDLHAVAQRCFEREQTSDTRDAHARTVRRRMDYHLLPQLRQQKSSGDEILHSLNKSLDRFGASYIMPSSMLLHPSFTALNSRSAATEFLQRTTGVTFGYKH